MNSADKGLIAYFSHSGENYFNGSLQMISIGNTEKAAEIIQKISGFDLFKIESVKQYPVKYSECTRVAKIELAENARPELAKKISGIGDYPIIVLAFPCWWGTMPMPVWTFLESFDFSGKLILPFITHEGSGFGKSLEDLKKECPNSEIGKGLSIHGSDVDRSRKLIETWVRNSINKK